MFGGSSAQALGYANAALAIALMQKLVANGTITKDQAAEVIEDATNILGPMGHITSIAEAIRLMPEVKTQIAA
jgi:hypothetical protein